jgi:hypothetical protein
MQFVLDQTATKTPAEIYQDLQSSKSPGWEYTRPSQVYYRWQNSNSRIWRRDSDPFCSTQILLSERSECSSLWRFPTIWHSMMWTPLGTNPIDPTLPTITTTFPRIYFEDNSWVLRGASVFGRLSKGTWAINLHSQLDCIDLACRLLQIIRPRLPFSSPALHFVQPTVSSPVLAASFVSFYNIFGPRPTFFNRQGHVWKPSNLAKHSNSTVLLAYYSASYPNKTGVVKED